MAPTKPFGEYVRDHNVADDECYPWFGPKRSVALVVVVECCCGCLRFRETRGIFLDAVEADTALDDQMEGTGPALKGDRALCSLYVPVSCRGPLRWSCHLGCHTVDLC